MSGTKHRAKPAWRTDVPYDLGLIRGAVGRLSIPGGEGCCASVWRDETLCPCDKPVVAIRRWHAGEYDDDGEIGPEGVYDGVCKAHAVHDVIPLGEVLEAARGGGR